MGLLASYLDSINPLSTVKNIKAIVGDRDYIPGFDPFTDRSGGGGQVQTDTRDRQTNTDDTGTKNIPSNPYSEGAGGGGSSRDNSLLLAQLAGQEDNIRNTIGGIDSRLNQGLTQIDDDYNREVGRLNRDRGTTLGKLQNQRVDTERGKEQALGRVGDNARVLRNSVMQRIRQASGGGSSAMDVAGSAINRDTSLDRQGVVENFGQNFRQLKEVEDDATTKYDDAAVDYDRRKNEATRTLREGVLDQRNQLTGGLSDIARQRQALAGGGAGAIQAAGQPYQAQISQTNNAINSLFDRYRTPFAGVAPVQVKQTNLADYTVDRAAVNAGQQAGTPSGSASPYAQFLNRQEDEEKPLY